mgnify:CR=1 FL=1
MLASRRKLSRPPRSAQILARVSLQSLGGTQTCMDPPPLVKQPAAPLAGPPKPPSLGLSHIVHLECNTAPSCSVEVWPARRREALCACQSATHSTSQPCGCLDGCYHTCPLLPPLALSLSVPRIVCPAGTWTMAGYHLATTIATPAAYAYLPFAFANLGWAGGLVLLIMGIAVTCKPRPTLCLALCRCDISLDVFAAMAVVRVSLVPDAPRLLN